MIFPTYLFCLVMAVATPDRAPYTRNACTTTDTTLSLGRGRFRCYAHMSMDGSVHLSCYDETRVCDGDGNGTDDASCTVGRVTGRAYAQEVGR